jgi:hypothetical protein
MTSPLSHSSGPVAIKLEQHKLTSIRGKIFGAKSSLHDFQTNSLLVLYTVSLYFQLLHADYQFVKS